MVIQKALDFSSFHIPNSNDAHNIVLCFSVGKYKGQINVLHVNVKCPSVLRVGYFQGQRCHIFPGRLKTKPSWLLSGWRLGDTPIRLEPASSSFLFCLLSPSPSLLFYLTPLCQWETCFMAWFAQQKQQTNCWIWQKEQGRYYVVHLSSSCCPCQVCWQFFSLVKYRLKKRRRMVERVADKQCTFTATRNTKYCFSRLLEYAKSERKNLVICTVEPPNSATVTLFSPCFFTIFKLKI